VNRPLPLEIEYFARLFRWGHWANLESLGSLRRSGGPAQAIRWLAHIAGAEMLWLSRLRDEPPSVPVWPDFDLDDCAVRLEQSGVAWAAHLAGLMADDLGDAVGYRNSKGEFWTSTVADILTHVSHHGAYHRGQIAAAVRAAGHEPAYTDLIHAVRQGLVG
jgi:uncharacterized damage-inducible protein DinB